MKNWWYSVFDGVRLAGKIMSVLCGALGAIFFFTSILFYSRDECRRKGETSCGPLGLNYYFLLINQVVDLVVKRLVTAL